MRLAQPVGWAHYYMMAGGPGQGAPVKAPVHLWLVGVLLVLWNAWGVALAIGVQTSQLPTKTPEDAAFFEAQPLWIVILADIGAVAGVAGAVSLLLQSGWALRFFVAQVAIIGLTNLYEVANGTSLLLSSQAVRVTTTVLAVLLCAQILYAWAMKRRKVLD